MNAKIKVIESKIPVFILGFFVGSFLTFSFMATAYVFYKIGKKNAYLQPAPRAKKQTKRAGRVQKRGAKGDFSLSFEAGELEWFGPRESAQIENSSEHVTDGKRSLMIDFPAGASFPGITWEVYKARECINWRNKSAFSFDIYNESDQAVNLSVKLKSGANYPKKKFSRLVKLMPKQVTNVNIPMSNISSALDISKISYINFFLDKPGYNTRLYLDNIRVK